MPKTKIKVRRGWKIKPVTKVKPNSKGYKRVGRAAWERFHDWHEGTE